MTSESTSTCRGTPPVDLPSPKMPQSAKVKRERLRLPRKCTLHNGNPCGACADLAGFVSCSTEVDHEKLSVLCQKVNECHDTLSNRLPVEVISKIFGHFPDCSGYTDSVYADPNKMITTSPFRITSVCRRWRDIGHKTAALWSSLIINTRSAYHAPRQLQGSDLVRLWLAMSGNQPLKLRIDVEEHAVNIMSPQMHEMLSLIASHNCRWDTLILLMQCHFFPCLFNKPSIEAPILHHLEIHIYETCHPRPQFLSTLISHSLAVVSISYLDISKSQIDWTNVTELSVNNLPWNVIVSILGIAQNLDRVKVMELQTEVNLAVGDIVVNHSLRSLELYPSSYDFDDDDSDGHVDNDDLSTCLPNALRHFCFPNLSELTVDAVGCCLLAKPWKGILDLVRTSKCLITHLTILRAKVDIIAFHLFTQMLQAMPSLERLSLSCKPGCSLASAIISHLTPPSIPVPRLKDLELEEYASSTDILLTLTVFLSRFSAMESLGTAMPSKLCVRIRLVHNHEDGPLVVPFKILRSLLRAKAEAAERVDVTVTERTLKNGTFSDTDLLRSSRAHYGSNT